MTDWKKVNGSQPTKPEEFDTTTSAIVVYQRRNIKEVETESADGTKTKGWGYEERELTKEEFQEIYVNSMSDQLAQARADIDFLSAMTGTDL